MKQVRESVHLEDIHSSGRSVCRPEGKSIYLDGGIPGETVTYTLDRRNQKFRSGKVHAVLHASSFREVPFCSHFGHCGGCTWQHIEYNHQLELKHSILTGAFDKYRIKSPPIPAVMASPVTRNYRHRMEYAFASGKWKERGILPDPVLGFHQNGQQEVLDIEECFLQSEPSRSICNFLKSFALENKLEAFNHRTYSGWLRSLSLRINRSGEVLVIIGFGEDRPGMRDQLLGGLSAAFPQIVSMCYTIHLSSAHSQLQGNIVPYGKSEPWIYENADNLRFRIHASSFFQPNVFQAEQIFRTIRDWVQPTGKEKIYDLYTGVGTLALLLSSGAEVTGIESSESSIDDATHNAGLNGIQNARFIQGDILKTFNPSFIETHGKPDIIVLDPPRSGTLIEIKKTIQHSGARKLIYLSCNPVSLAYDLNQLTENYTITRILPFDMLPHTHHLETLVMLDHK